MTPDSIQADEALIEQFLAGQPEEAASAFEELMSRYGPLVMRVCRQTANQQQDAEDAFQVSFLTLARKAGTIRNQRVLGPWLHAVAYRIAVRMRARTARQCALDLSGNEVSTADGDSDLERGDLQRIVHAELERLPENYRAAAVHCFLEGKTCRQAARILGRPVGTIKGQLSRARTLLRMRLDRRTGKDLDQWARPYKPAKRQSLRYQR
jgi:RNA polymerase sigma factor (sigma-70 family)